MEFKGTLSTHSNFGNYCEVEGLTICNLKTHYKVALVRVVCHCYKGENVDQWNQNVESVTKPLNIQPNNFWGGYQN